MKHSPAHRHGIPRSPIIVFAILLVSIAPSISSAGDTPSHGWTIRHHRLTITLVPSTHRLIAQDAVTLQKTGTIEHPQLVVTLNPHLALESVRAGSQVLRFTTRPGAPPPGSTPEPDSPRPSDPSFPSPDYIAIDLPDSLETKGTFTLTFTYQGAIDDPPHPSSGLRYVRPDRTTGHIGPEGVYLTAETFWYPDIAGSLTTYELEATVPSGWMVVSQGAGRHRQTREGSVVSTWVTRLPGEALTLSANRFVRQSRQWRTITLSTYLLPANRHLADVYLDATVRYMEFYTAVLGPYPFPKFAIVENFFPSGIGVPSFTLLGSRIISRRYTQPYALGHEIVHSWIGNAVYNDLSQGNWVEGLTTYLANYYYDEVHTHPDQARTHRHRMVIEYNLYAPPGEDYPLTRFQSKTHPRDNAIGYQKAAMIFHMLRREIGDSAFFAGLRVLVAEWIGAHVTWDIVQDVFEHTARRELGWFFEQWIARPGAPSISIEHARIDHANGWSLHATIAQRSPVYHLRVPFRITLANGETLDRTLESFATPDVTLRIPLSHQPTRLSLDPDFDLLRRLARDQIPPMLNLWVTDSSRAIVLPADWPKEEEHALLPLLHRLRRNPSILVRKGNPDFTEAASLLILGNPRHHLASLREHLHACPNRVTVGPSQISIAEQRFTGREIAVLVSCPHPQIPGHVISWFYGFTPAAAKDVARLLFFYGWDSYVVFQDGKVIARDWFPPSHTATEVHWHVRSTTEQPAESR